MQITVNGQHIAIVDDTLVSNSVNIYECEFEFDASWDGFAKTSVWQLNSDEPIEVVIDDGVAVIPHEVLENAGILRIGVYGTKDEKVMPTVWLEKRKVCLGTPTGSIGTEPTPSIYAQILAVATNAEDVANGVKTEWESVTATAETLEPTESASVVFEDNTFKFGIPQGERGTDGTDGFSPIVTVAPITNGHRVTITDAEGVHTFDVLDGTDGADGVGITNIVMNADYTLTITLSNGTSFTTPSIRGEQGEKGDTGNGIASITKTATVGKVDTYTITYTDGTTTTFDVTNGEVTEASLEERLIDKADVITNTASGSIATFDDGANMPVKSLEVEINAVQSGSGDPSPTNIRPISGWDEVDVTRTGKNLYNNSATASLVPCYSGNVAQTQTRKGYVLDLPSDTYTLSGQRIDSNSCYIYGNIVSADDSLVRFFYITTGTNTPDTITFTLTQGEKLIVFDQQAQYSSSDDKTKYLNIQVEKGSTATDYEPYNGTTYPITLPSTCYGGKADVVSGSGEVIGTLDTTRLENGNIVSDYFYLAPNGATVIGDNVRLQFNRKSQQDGLNISSNTYANKMFNMAPHYFSFASDTVHWYLNNQLYVYLPKTLVGETLASAIAYLTDHPLEVYLEFATPQTITLTPTEVSTVLGYNNIFADSGEVSVTYRADTKAYIDGTIVDVPLAMIAPIETGTKSSKAYAVGEYFILNGTQFCKAKTAIASGATFTLNTNYTVTTIGAELKALA